VPDYFQHLRAWRERTEQLLRSKWWLWPIVVALDLLKHSLYEHTNEFMASHSGWAIGMARTVLSANPIVLMVGASLLIVLGLAILAYFDVRKGAVSPPAPSSPPPPAEVQAPPIAPVAEAASTESVLLLRVLYKDYLERTFTLAREFFGATSMPAYALLSVI
jgi:hypothetical protein